MKTPTEIVANLMTRPMPEDRLCADVSLVPEDIQAIQADAELSGRIKGLREAWQICRARLHLRPKSYGARDEIVRIKLALEAEIKKLETK